MTTVTVSVASAGDLDQLVASVAALFREDAGQHDPYVDVDWPVLEGTAHYTKLLDDPACLLALAHADGRAAGHLVGKLSEPSPTRPARFAVLESLYVVPEARGSGVGTQLVGHFKTWARDHGAQQASVSAYAANARAQHLYQRLGFAPQSVTLRTAL